MRRQALLSALLLASFLPAAAIAAPAADPAMRSTPQGALHYYDLTVPDGGEKKALEFYNATTAEQKKMAAAMARVDASAAKLQSLLESKFGHDGATLVLHAMRNEVAEDIDAAQIKVQGDKATVVWKDGRDPANLIRVDGQWRMDVAEVAKVLSKEYPVEEFVKANDDVAEIFEKAAQEVRDGKYANAALLQRVMKRRLEKVLGEDTKGD